MFFDKDFGNLLKVDQFGNILVCYHGFELVPSTQVRELYPNKTVQASDHRYFVLNTLFNLPETYIIAALVNYFDSHSDYTKVKNGVECGNVLVSYKSMHQDLRAAMDWVHNEGHLKARTLENVEKYVVKDPRLPILLKRLRTHGRKVFLLTNSDYHYTDSVLSYLLSEDSEPREETTGGKVWTSYFDYVVVDAQKPVYFEGGTTLRQINETTGKPGMGVFLGKIQQGSIYSGGDSETFCEMIGAVGEDVLYIGDHIFGDILKSKKQHGWRTYLVVRELEEDLGVLTDGRDLYNQLALVEDELEDVYRDLDSHHEICPNITSYLRRMKELVFSIDQRQSTKLGSIFRSGTRQTFFAMQAMRYADLYSSSPLNLINYPFSYFFRAKAQLMPHETVVEHEHHSMQDLLTANEDVGKAASPPRENDYKPPTSTPDTSRKAKLLHYQSFTHDMDDEENQFTRMASLDEFDGDVTQTS
ncbi:cytosolic purine 5'-nucleotidase-like isoform X2 [Corticium candelabrum]|nr:cytosolic purine 5'-nucleotidase-like isoform X2 [Corticium candelabrum]